MVTITLNLSGETLSRLDQVYIREVAFSSRGAKVGRVLSDLWKQNGGWMFVKGLPLAVLDTFTWTCLKPLFPQHQAESDEPEDFEQLVPLLVKETLQYPIRTALCRYLAQDGFERYDRVWQPLIRDPAGLYSGYPIHLVYITARYVINKTLSGPVTKILEQRAPQTSTSNINAITRIGISIVTSLLLAPLPVIVVKMQANSDRDDKHYSSLNAVQILDEAVAEKGFILGLYCNGWMSLLYRTLFN